MLVLGRKPTERILIGDDVVVTIVESRPGKVRLGFNAPPSRAIVREGVVSELDERIEAIAGERVASPTDGRSDQQECVTPRRQ